MDLTAFSELAQKRRTSLFMDLSKPVDPDLVDQLIDLVSWAPNHKRTWPWRIAVCTNDGRARLGQAFASDLMSAGVSDEGRLAKTAAKYIRSPVVVVVASAAHSEGETHDENRDAVAAGLQNFLLGATAVGLASFWASPPTRESPTVHALCGFDADAQIVGIVYLGWPNEAEVLAPARSTPVISYVD